MRWWYTFLLLCVFARCIRAQVQRGEQVLLNEAAQHERFPDSPSKRLRRAQQTGAVTSRIIGGTSADPERYSYFTYLFIHTSRGTFKCGGSLIFPDIVLTAAHCIKDFQMTRVEIDSIEAIVNYQSRSDSSNQRYRVVSAKLSHPNYEYRSNANDIMLLRLDQPVYGIPTPSIQGSDTLAPGDAVKVLGMGKTGGAVANDLQVVTVEIIRHGDCNDANSYNGQIFKNLMICAAAPGKDSCNGDSGGPLIVPSDTGNANSDVIVGIVSWGEGCALPDKPGVYTNVTFYNDFIERTVCALSSDPPISCQRNNPSPPKKPTTSPVAFLPPEEAFLSLGCFSGEMTVEIRDGKSVFMKDLQRGDEVKVADGSYERVYGFGHRHETLEIEYLELILSTGTVLEISADHMVSVQGNFLPAKEIRNGNVVSVLMDGTMAMFKVVAIQRIVRKGAYAPFTWSGTILVNGVLASTYVALPSLPLSSYQAVSHLATLPRRILCWVGCDESYFESGIATWIEPLLLWAFWLKSLANDS